MPDRKHVVMLTREEAERVGIVLCKTCTEKGHPWHRSNNHFNYINGCAHCDCKKFEPYYSVGEEIKEINVDDTLKQTIKGFLSYSLKEIEYDYHRLTETEKAICTKADFEKMVAWIKEK